MVQAISQSHQQIYQTSNIGLLTATQTLTNKTLTSSSINGGTLESISSLHMSNGSISLEGSTDDAHETTLTVTELTADRTITFSDATGNVVVFATADWIPQLQTVLVDSS